MQTGKSHGRERCLHLVRTISVRLFRFGGSCRFHGSPLYSFFLTGLAFANFCTARAATRSLKQLIVPEWSRFEQVFVSTFTYTNPLQEANFTAVFTSPQGETSTIEGFWDGGRIWRIRFCPDTPGQWTFTTACSDRKNQGLDSQVGKFLCTAPIGDGAFQRHGPLRIARDHRHFEHADGMPFFWIADTVWDGARLASARDWQRYATIRSSQAFNVAVWSVAQGEDMEYESALNGFPDQIGINPGFFQRLDAKLETLSREGILSAILPFADPGTGDKYEMPARQSALFYRYLIARWGSEPVAWLFNGSGKSNTDPTGFWKTIGKVVCLNTVHAPVILLIGNGCDETNLVHDLFWVDAYGVFVANNSVKENIGATAIRKSPALPGRPCPVVVFAPTENGIELPSRTRWSSDEVRRAMYEALLTHTPAGITYCGQGVVDWDGATDASNASDLGRDLPVWEKALFMPGAKQIRPLAELMRTIEFWRLRPQANSLIAWSGSEASQQQAVALSTDSGDLSLIYLPGPLPVAVSTHALPTSPQITWWEPRQGYSRSGAAVVSGPACQFQPPTDSDWLLLIRSGK